MPIEKGLNKGLEHIFILGRGSSLVRCPPKKPVNTEYWGCNNIYKVRDVDKLFIMRDTYITQFNRDEDLIKNINKKDFPVYTLGKYVEIKNNVLYPMEEVIKEFGTAYFLNTISYILALAITQEPKNLVLFGVDMFFSTSTEYMRNEKACLEFWLGIAIGKGIRVQITAESTLLKRRGRNTFYGMNLIQKDKGEQPILVPNYTWGRPKCAKKYKIFKFIDSF